MDYIIEVAGLMKYYNKQKVTDNISFRLKSGDICALLGLNGAGKTVLLKLVTSLAIRDSGSVSICGFDLDKHFTDAIQNVGISIDSIGFYEDLTGFQNIKLVYDLCKSNKYDIDYLLNIMELNKVAHKKVKEYSMGMKKKLELARALLNEPKIIILDEPTNGLDPKGIRFIYEFIKKMSIEQDITFIISSHNLHDMEQLSNKVLMINEGRAVVFDKTKVLIDKYKTLENMFFSHI